VPDMILAESRYRAITAQAWSAMLAVLLTMLIADVDRLAIQGSYAELAESLGADPGLGGLWVLVCLICLNALVQISVHTFDVPLFRRLVFWTSVAYTVFFILHQAAHVAAGERFSLHTILDLTHHVLGLWACWASGRWSRLARARV
jgi:hypothetical protein